MKKLAIMLLLIILSFSVVFADNARIKLNAEKQKIEIIENNFQKLHFNIELSEILSFDVKTKKGTFTQLTIPHAYYIGDVGKPKIPAIKKLIEIPFDADVSVNVKSFSEKNFNLADYGITKPVIPAQPSIPKNVDPQTVDFEFDESSYAKNAYTQNKLVKIEILGIMRGVRLALLTVTPVSYNPVAGDIKVSNNIDLEINFTNSNIEKTKNIKISTYSPYFEPVYEKIINYKGLKDYPDHPDLTKYPIKYLIVANSMFETTLQPFVEWKSQKGFTVLEAYTDSIGSSYNEIQTYIHTIYNSGTPTDPAPTFVLFVGDTGQLVSGTGSQTSKVTDLYYCSVDGDMFPEMYYGRFSATDTTELQTQIDRTLYYEKYQFNDPTYLDNATLIAGADYSHNPTHGQPTVLYGTENYFNVANGFTTINLYLTDPYSGCYNTIEDGITIINYTAHGSQTSWSNPNLSQSMVNSYSNVGKYPLAIGNCCLSGDFGYSECFGETWARATDNTTDEPTGSIVYIASAPSSYWDEDVYWAVGAFADVGSGVTPTYGETTWGMYDASFVTDYVSADALNFVGNLAVTEAENQGFPMITSAQYYWQAYNLLGDPSVIIYMTQGEVNNVSFAGILPIGVDHFTVNAEPFSYVGISMNGVLHGSALADEFGVADVPINPFLAEGTADIVVTKPQYQPVITTVPVTTPSVVYIDPDSLEINTLTEVNISVYEGDGATPIPDVYVEVSGYGLFGDYTDSTDTNGECTLNFGCNYGGNEVLNIKGKRSGDSYYLINENIDVYGGTELTNTDIWVSTTYGLSDTFGLNMPATVHFEQNEDSCIYAIYDIDADTTIFSSFNEIIYTPNTITEIWTGIMKSGYNIYCEEFPTIEVYGTVSGTVTDIESGTAISNAELRFYQQGVVPTGNPLFTATTNSLGEYEVTEEHPVSYYDIYIDKWGFNPYIELGYFLAYGDNIHNIQMNPVASGMVTGKVYSPFFPLSQGTLTYCRSDNGEEYASVSISDLSYSVILPQFTYYVKVTSSGFVPYEGSLTVEGDMHIDYHLGIAALYSEFENNNGNFVSNDSSGWQWGEPTAGGISAYSGVNVWGTVLDGFYGTNYANWTLDSPEFIVPDSCLLTFYHYYDFEGGWTLWDGGNVKITTDGGSTFELIIPEEGYDGDISALGEPGFGGSIDDWQEVIFNLEIFADEVASLRWHFASDVSLCSFYGWYIDNVLVGDPSTSSQEIISANDEITQPLKLTLNQNFPNPVDGSTTIKFYVPKNSKNLSLNIYNLRGQLVKSYKPKTKDIDPIMEFIWDTRDENGNPVSNGIYFYKLSTDNNEIIKKMTIIK